MNPKEILGANFRAQLELERAQLKKDSISKHGFKSDKPGYIAFLTPNELAKALSISTKTLERWRARKEGPAFIKAGNKQIRYPKKALDAWIDGLLDENNGSDNAQSIPQESNKKEGSHDENN